MLTWIFLYLYRVEYFNPRIHDSFKTYKFTVHAVFTLSSTPHPHRLRRRLRCRRRLLPPCLETMSSLASRMAVLYCPLFQNPMVGWKRCSLAFDDSLIALTFAAESQTIAGKKRGTTCSPSGRILIDGQVPATLARWDKRKLQGQRL